MLKGNHKHRSIYRNSLFSRTTWVSWCQKDKTSPDLNEARDDGFWGWQWHPLGHMQTICTLLQTDNHINTPSPYHSIFTVRMLFLMPNQQCQSTKGINIQNKPRLKQNYCLWSSLVKNLLLCWEVLLLLLQATTEIAYLWVVHLFVLKIYRYKRNKQLPVLPASREQGCGAGTPCSKDSYGVGTWCCLGQHAINTMQQGG